MRFTFREIVVSLVLVTVTLGAETAAGKYGNRYVQLAVQMGAIFLLANSARFFKSEEDEFYDEEPEPHSDIEAAPAED